MRRVLRFLLLWVCFATPAWAQDGLSEAARAFEQGEFERALQRLDQLSAEVRDDATLSRVHLLRGRCFAALQRFDQVESAFEKALEHDPEAKLDPNEVLPTVVAVLDGVRDRLKGVVDVSVDPETPLEVVIDGRPAGTAPVRSPLSIGRHRISARSPDGAELAFREVVLRAGQTERVVLALPTAKEPERPVSSAPSAPLELGPTVALRGIVDPTAGVAFDVGAGLGGRHWLVTGHFTLGGAPGVGLRAALRAPALLGPVGAHASLDGAMFFASPASPGVGGSVGLSYPLGKWLGVFVEGSGLRFFDTGPFKQTYFLAALGLAADFR